MGTFLPLFGLAIGLVVAAVTDVREGRIPNWLTGSLAVFGIGVIAWAWLGWIPVQSRRIGHGVGLLDVFLY